MVSRALCSVMRREPGFRALSLCVAFHNSVTGTRATRGDRARSFAIGERPLIPEERAHVVRVVSLGLEEARHHPRRLRQQRTKTLLPSLAQDAYEGGTREMEVGWRHVEELLDAGAGVIEQGQQEVVPPALAGGAIDLTEEVFQFLGAEVSQSGSYSLLHGNHQHPLTERRVS